MHSEQWRLDPAIEQACLYFLSFSEHRVFQILCPVPLSFINAKGQGQTNVILV